jgi:hypothetical protein
MEPSALWMMMRAVLVAAALTVSPVAASAAQQPASTSTDFRDYETVQQVVDRYRAHDVGAIMYVQGFAMGLLMASSRGEPYCDADGKSADFNADQLIDVTAGYAVSHPYATKLFSILALDAIRATFPCHGNDPLGLPPGTRCLTR